MTLNGWNYVQGNPINFIDPSGLYPIQGCQEDDCTVHEVVSFIVNRMREDAASKEINNIRTLNETQYYEDAWDAFEKMPWWQRLLVGPDYLRSALNADAAARELALVQFGCLVADARSRPICGQWDYKVEIQALFQNSQRIDFCSIGIDEEVVFYYDIWANIHFGYVGMAGGFSEDLLLTGATIEHAGSNWGQFEDDSSDQVSAKIGIRLYRSALTEETFTEKN